MQASPARERLLEGFARRLAVARDAEAYVLRGGLLVRSWEPEPTRRVRDLDLICGLPCRPRELRARFGEVLATSLEDGVRFEAERFRVDTERDAAMLYATGEVAGEVAELRVDLVFGREIWPRAARQVVGAIALWTCPHEMVIGTKLAVLAELGPHAWRPKDLADLWRASRRFERSTRLGEAIARGLARSPRGLDLHDLLAASWWRGPEAAARWARHLVHAASLPVDLAAVLAEVRHFLRPYERHA